MFDAYAYQIGRTYYKTRADGYPVKDFHPLEKAAYFKEVFERARIRGLRLHLKRAHNAIIFLIEKEKENVLEEKTIERAETDTVLSGA